MQNVAQSRPQLGVASNLLAQLELMNAIDCQRVRVEPGRSGTATLIGLGEDVFVLAVANDEGALALLLAPHELETS